MCCYGEKEEWYTEKVVATGMLPAIEMKGTVVADSDACMAALEDEFGPIGLSFEHPQVVALRKLEREVFSQWCRWLCYPAEDEEEEQDNEEDFDDTIGKLEKVLGRTGGAYFLGEFGVADVVFTAYLDRIAASLCFFKGYVLRDPKVRPRICAWFDAMEARDAYTGMQSDFHTHVHALPPQMGGCYENGSERQQAFKRQIVEVEECAELRRAEASYAEKPGAVLEAVSRVCRFHKNVIRVNPAEDKAMVDVALRTALTHLVKGESRIPPAGADAVLRFIRDRVNVPRDMSLSAGRRMRRALEVTAARAGSTNGTPVTTTHRRDQNPMNFATRVPGFYAYAAIEE